MFCQSKLREVFVVQRLSTKRTHGGAPVGPDDLWEPMVDFNLDEYDKACAYAMDLSRDKREIKEVAVFDDGVGVPAPGVVAHPMLYTRRQYPCGCTAEGPGDVPAYCGTHGSTTNGQNCTPTADAIHSAQ
jgi:hypothetical protein